MNTPRQIISLSRSKGGVSNTVLENWNPSIGVLSSMLSKPKVGEKDGSYFVRGPLKHGASKRADGNIETASLIILDCDGTVIPETGAIEEGAPPPKQVSGVLTRLGIKHILYTTHSHGIKGNRYRVLVFPDRPLANQSELKACVDWLIAKFHVRGIMLKSAKENYSWSQPWYRPRIREEGAEFIYLEHTDGACLSVKKCVRWLAKKTVGKEDKIAVPPVHPTIHAPNSVIDKYNAEHGTGNAMLDFLKAKGYELKKSEVIDGLEAYRLLAPKSTSRKPGVVLFQSKTRVWRVCSHHGDNSDPLAVWDKNGQVLAHDAFDLFRILNHAGDETAALASLRKTQTTIKVFGGSFADNVKQGIEALAASYPPQVFQRGPLLCRVAHLPELKEFQGCKIPSGTAVVLSLTPGDLLLRLSMVATWQKPRKVNGEVKYEVIDPPPKIAQGILGAQGEWGSIPTLEAIVETPILRKDGSIHDEVGYDFTTGLYHEGTCPPLNIPQYPTRTDAQNAARYLLKVFAEFPFVDKKVAQSVVLAYILTLILRGQITLAPLFAISATAPGTGKGLLIETINLIVRGRDAAIMPPVSGNGAEEETRKRITALLLQGANSVNLDNWTTPIGGESLNGLLTANEWSDRVLGRSETVKLLNRVTWAATGNNLTVRGDMVRRTLLVQIDAKTERPELRQFENSNLARHVLDHRPELLSAAFTILRAYQQAGRPKDAGQALGRFEQWWRAVCAPIIWLGLPNPVLSQDRLRKDDPEMARLERLLTTWYRVLGDRSVSVAELIRKVGDATDNSRKLSELRDALQDCAGNGNASINSKSLGWYLKKFSGRIVGPHQLIRVDGIRGAAPKYVAAAVAEETSST